MASPKKKKKGCVARASDVTLRVEGCEEQHREPRKKSPAGKDNDKGYSSEVKACVTQKTEFRDLREWPRKGEG